MKGDIAQALHGDILNEVLNYTLPSSITPGKILSASPLNASHVCRSWRTTVVGSSNLWASLSIHLSADEAGDASPRTHSARSIAKCVDMWLQRSSPLPLNISLNGDTTSIVEDPKAEKRRFDAIVSKMHRWGRRVIGSSTERSSRTSLSIFGNPLPQRPIVLDTTSLSLLHSLVLSKGMIRLPIGTLPQMINLANLDISVAEKQSLDDIFSLLEASPNLTKLSLSFKDTLIQSSTPEVAITTLNHLTELRVTFLGPCPMSFTLAYLIARLSSSSLSTLIVSERRDIGAAGVIRDLDEITRFLARTGGAALNDMRLVYDEASIKSMISDPEMRVIDLLNPVKEHLRHDICENKYKLHLSFNHNKENISSSMGYGDRTPPPYPDMVPGDRLFTLIDTHGRVHERRFRRTDNISVEDLFKGFGPGVTAASSSMYVCN